MVSGRAGARGTTEIESHRPGSRDLGFCLWLKEDAGGVPRIACICQTPAGKTHAAGEVRPPQQRNRLSGTGHGLAIAWDAFAVENVSES